MKAKLSHYSDFAHSLLPEEALIVSSQCRFKDPENIDILNRSVICAISPDSFQGFKHTIDKRKYTYVKNWIIRKLQSYDVDELYDWMVDTERMVMHDNIRPEREKQLIQILNNASSSDFFFLKLYELAVYYYHFAQIRMKDQASEVVKIFIDHHTESYQLGRASLEYLAKITDKITALYLGKSTLEVEGELKLQSFFFDENLPGMIRYYALVRLTFLYYLENRLEQILPFYELMKQFFTKGTYYSKRILTNYYSNLLIIHSKLGSLYKAEQFGKYTIHNRNSDFLHYLNNLAAVQLRLQKIDEALETLKLGVREARTTDNFHTKQGFTALFIRALSEKGQIKAAEKYGEGFIENHKKDLLKARWHLFFTTHFHTLWILERYRRIITLTKSMGLIPQEEMLKSTSRYAPVLALYYYLSLYQEGKLSGDELRDRIRMYNIELQNHPEYKTTLDHLQRRLRVNFDTLIFGQGSENIFM